MNCYKIHTNTYDIEYFSIVIYAKLNTRGKIKYGIVNKYPGLLEFSEFIKKLPSLRLPTKTPLNLMGGPISSVSIVETAASGNKNIEQYRKIFRLRSLFKYGSSECKNGRFN